jgi:hypothetical protein
MGNNYVLDTVTGVMYAPHVADKLEPGAMRFEGK